MNKQKFFKLMDTRDKKFPVRVTWGSIFNQLERQVYLAGSFNKGTQSFITLYVPLPGRQGQDCYKTANEKCEKECRKYQRWLDEYLYGKEEKK